MKDPCGRSSFQETITRAEQKNPRNTIEQATKSKEVHNNKIGEVRNRETAEETDDQCHNVRRLSFRELESGSRVVKNAWAKKDENS